MADHPMPDAPVDIPIDKVYFSYWSGPRQVSRSVVPIKKTPHYRFAMAALAIADPEANPPHGTGYGRYARWESYCFYGAVGVHPQMHSEVYFGRNLKAWKQLNGFNRDIAIEALSDPTGSYFVIEDGAHRSAFLAAIGSPTVRATVKAMYPNTYTGIDLDALTVNNIKALEDTIPRN